MQSSTAAAQSAPWYLGRGAMRKNFSTPLTPGEVRERLFPYKGMSRSGGQLYQDKTVVTGTGNGGFTVVMRDPGVTFRQPMAGCRWKPSETGTAFEATIIPGRTLGTTVQQIVPAIFLLAAAPIFLPPMGVPALLSFGIAVVLAVVAFNVAQNVIPRGSEQNDAQQRELLTQFLRDELGAVDMPPA